MIRLIFFELRKIWQKRSFLLAVAVLLVIHLFLLWYTTLPGEETCGLSSYRALNRKLSGMSEQEKGEYLASWKENVEGACFVREILALQSFDNEMGGTLAQQELASHPGMFEANYQAYQNMEYLWYTDSPDKERALMEEIWEEWEKTAGYGEYLSSIQQQKDSLEGISVFGGQEKDSYSARNLKKSAEDYRGLRAEQICFTPSRAVRLAMEGYWPKLLLFLGLLLFVGSLITEEKEKGLFLITRGTRYGIGHSIGAKLLALLLHCLVMTALFYGAGLLFAGASAGWFDPGIRLQSLAVYRESCLDLTVGGYLLLSVATQALVFFGIGALLVFFSLLWDLAVLPFLAGLLAAGASMLLYGLIPAGSPLAALKYLNPAGLLQTDQIYGGYLNFNVMGYPLSRRGLVIFFTILLAAAGVAGSFLVFGQRRGFGARKLGLRLALPFHPHAGRMRHESYKLLITGRGLVLAVVFAALLGGKDLSRTYHPSVGEQYYQELMGRLEGELNEEKEALVLAERQRYEEAFENLSRIDAMVEAGTLSDAEADERRTKEYMVLSFYPSFQRVEDQYRRIADGGAGFVYDTGYRYLLGLWEDGFSVDFLILSVGVILIASGAVSMEYQKGAWYLLGATRTGRNRILLNKCLICGAQAALLALVPLVCRFCAISRVYPMRSPLAEIGSLLPETGAGSGIPILLFLVLFVLSQLLAVLLVMLITLGLSFWRRQQASTVFFALVLLAVPMALKLLGFETAKWFSLYPLYGWTGMV